MTDGILATGESEMPGIGVEKVVLFDLTRVGGEVLVDVGQAEARNRAGGQRRNIKDAVEGSGRSGPGWDRCWARCLRLWRL